jgi:hypothetical protein
MWLWMLGAVATEVQEQLAEYFLQQYELSMQ